MFLLRYEFVKSHEVFTELGRKGKQVSKGCAAEENATGP
jgi:hypothetical protein